MRKLILLILVLLLAAPALAQQHSHNKRFLCGDTATGSTPLHLYNTATGEWCPGATVNDAGNDVDVCIEGDTDTTLLCTNAGTERVGVSTSSPQALLDVRGPAGTGAAAAGVAVLATDETTVVDADQLGCVNFQAPLEASGTDAILVGAGICAEANATFSATVNTTDLVFKTATTAAAAEVMRLLSNGLLQFVSKTADPCSAGAEGSIFWNDTSNYFCFCDGTNDLKMNDNTTACF